MHKDFHYFGTYTLARAAGLRPTICQVIASAAQFVDDNDGKKTINFDDGGRLEVFPTAHPLFNIANTEFFDRDQRRVWVPFHFLPGNKGKSMSERLVCRKDSGIAQEMIGHCASLIDKPFGYHLIGIAAHVYADTFSHYGFSGVSSRWNAVVGDSLALLNDDRDVDTENRFIEKYGSTMAGLKNWRALVDSVQSSLAETGTGALGHGAVLKYPDYPYLKWEYSYEHRGWKEGLSRRNNPQTYLDACEKLHELFVRIGKGCPNATNKQRRSFNDIRDLVTEILETKEPEPQKRELKWIDAAGKGELLGKSEEFLPYLGDEWKGSLDRLKKDQSSSSVCELPVFRFLQGAATYRSYVLRDLLPAHGLVVD